MVFIRQVHAIVLCCALAAIPGFAQTTAHTASAAPTAKELQELVAPIALYPDQLVAQILAASTYPTEVVEATRWVQQNSSLKGEALGKAIDQQSWDPSVKALAEFPSVLHNMSQNLAWTSNLGDAYFNEPKDVMEAIQVLRTEAEKKGNLKSTSEQTVTNQGDTIIIEPAQPDVVYVPAYSSEVYGGYVEPYPGYSGWDMAAASALSFGVGTMVGAAMGNWGWGWNSWGADWHGGNVQFNRNTFVSNSNAFVNRSNFNQINRANVNRSEFDRNAANRANINKGEFNRPNNVQNLKPSSGQFQSRNWAQESKAASRGFSQSDFSRGSHSGAFGGFSQGGGARMDSFRGHSSFGGGGFHGGGGFGGGRMGGGGRR